MIGVCLKANRWFTLFGKYEITFYAEGIIAVKSDYGSYWFFSHKGDGYYECMHANEGEAIFLVE